MSKCRFCREEYTCDVDNGFCDEVGIWEHAIMGV